MLFCSCQAVPGGSLYLNLYFYLKKFRSVIEFGAFPPRHRKDGKNYGNSCSGRSRIYRFPYCVRAHPGRTGRGGGRQPAHRLPGRRPPQGPLLSGGHPGPGSYGQAVPDRAHRRCHPLRRLLPGGRVYGRPPEVLRQQPVRHHHSAAVYGGPRGGQDRILLHRRHLWRT